MKRFFSFLTALCLGVATLAPAPAEAVRIKDIASFSGVRDNQLVGYGLVVEKSRLLMFRVSVLCWLKSKGTARSMVAPPGM